MVNRRASPSPPNLLATPRHFIAEPRHSLLGKEISPDSEWVDTLPPALHFSSTFVRARGSGQLKWHQEALRTEGIEMI